jgi:hypothetical protein
MVVIARKVGRLANRILLFAHFIGAAIEHGFRVANPSFDHYARYFPSTSHDFFCRFPATGSFATAGYVGRSFLYHATLNSANALHAFQRRGYDVGLIRLRRDQFLDLDSPQFLSKLDRHRVLFVQDWFFRSAADCEKHGDAIRSYFTPWEHHLDRVRALAEEARLKGKFLVGIHLRQDDYSTFKGGRFFYSHRQYRHVMEQLRMTFADKPVSFLVCSDAPVPDGAFDGMDVSYGNGNELEDLYALASCDLIVGPPSTYSIWASFYGMVPRYEIQDPECLPTPELFQVAIGLSHLQVIGSATLSDG